MPKVHKQKANKDYPDHNILKGEVYYWWKFRYGGKRISKTSPTLSQLTTSEYKIALYSIIEKFPLEVYCIDDLISEVEEIKSDLETIRDETQEKFDNLPENFQNSSVGELLQERIDNLENIISEFELDLEIDEELSEEEQEVKFQELLEEVNNIEIGVN